MTLPYSAPRRSWRRAPYLTVLIVLLAVVVVSWPALTRIRSIVRIVRTEPVLPYPVPVEGVLPLRLTDSWGAARSGNRHHQGIDIFAPCGTPIHSATDGVVFTVGTNSLGGQIVRILGPGGYWHYYAHLSRYGDVREGQVVQAGTVLGYVGVTGNAQGTPCHLHYGIYTWGNRPRNPYVLLTDSAQRDSVQRNRARQRRR
jgi:murein DD-endopeptidase MepM/ murein hydrolase activator NlpD